MGQRWTEEHLKKLRPGMVVDEKKVALPETRPPANEVPDKQAVQVEQKTGKTAAQALGRLAAGEMNQTEARYAELLELRKAAGEVLWWEFEPMNLRLGVNCFYQVDFMVMLADRSLEAHEVKGYWTDDALVKIRVAAAKFPFPFVAVRWMRKDKQWEYRYF